MSIVATAKGSSDWLAGGLSIATGVAGLVLLALHPAGSASTFAEVMREEAANLARNAVVHGGFIAVLAVQLVLYGVLSGRLDSRPASRTGFTFFAIGAAWLSLSMLLDGLVLPAFAERYALHPDRIESARPVFALVGVAVQRLMPLGLGFQGAAVLAWSVALFASRRAVSGVIALVLGAALAAAVYLGAFASMMVALMVGFVLLAAWAVLAGVVLIRR